jgi:hypothetical protein
MPVISASHSRLNTRAATGEIPRKSLQHCNTCKCGNRQSGPGAAMAQGRREDYRNALLIAARSAASFALERLELLTNERCEAILDLLARRLVGRRVVVSLSAVGGH